MHCEFVTTNNSMCSFVLCYMPAFRLGVEIYNHEIRYEKEGSAVNLFEFVYAHVPILQIEYEIP